MSKLCDTDINLQCACQTMQDYKVNHQLAIKEYSRSSADQAEPLIILIIFLI